MSIQRDYKDLKNRSEYYSEAGDTALAQGNNINHIEEKDTTKPVFHTSGGRIVYGGGGITPDYIVKSNNITSYTTDLLKNNIFYQFILGFLNQNEETIKNKYGKNLRSFVRNYQLPANTMGNFIGFAKSKGVKFNEKDFNTDEKYIATRLKAQIARNFWKNEGWYMVMQSIDRQLEKAENLFGEAKDLAKLK